MEIQTEKEKKINKKNIDIISREALEMIAVHITVVTVIVVQHS